MLQKKKPLLLQLNEGLFILFLIQMSSFWNSPAWSMARRPHSAQLKKSVPKFPGPGNYNLSKEIGDKVHGWKIGSSTRNSNHLSNVPGPGKYDNLYQTSGPKITMGLKPNILSKQLNVVPGPGNYDTTDKAINKCPSAFTMGAKYTSGKVEDFQPGPGTYNVDNNKKSGVKIGTSQRVNQKIKQNLPGPGSYTQNTRPQSAGPYYSFGGGQKSLLEKTQFVPGPGQYNYDSYLSKSKGITLGQRNTHNFEMSAMIPGPGQYENISKRPMSGTKIGKAERSLVNKSFAPGPGAYDCSYNAKKGIVKIGTGQRYHMDRRETPGPGAYELKNNPKGGVTISGIKNKKNIEITPGPGAYDGVSEGISKRPCSAKIGTGMRTKMQYSITPGPGTYNIHEFENCKFAFSKENRSKEMSSKDPGPGQYDIPATVPSVPYYECSVSKLGKSRQQQR